MRLQEAGGIVEPLGPVYLAGVAGVCFALVTERFKASTFDPSQSILVVAMVIIGGLGSIEGAVLGALYLVGIPAAFGSGPTVQFITSGFGVLIMILYFPGGFAQAARAIGDGVTAGIVRLRTRRGPSTAAPGELPVAAGVEP